LNDRLERDLLINKGIYMCLHANQQELLIQFYNSKHREIPNFEKWVSRRVASNNYLNRSTPAQTSLTRHLDQNQAIRDAVKQRVVNYATVDRTTSSFWNPENESTDTTRFSSEQLLNLIHNIENPPQRSSIWCL
jgi:hypothetical protein